MSATNHQDPYQVLGLTSNASDAQIRNAYRRLAKKYHPDLNPNNLIAEEKFKQVNLAYEQISDAEKRACYAQEQERRTHPRGRRQSWGGFPRGGRTEGSSYEETLDDILWQEMFGKKAQPKAQQESRTYLTIDFMEAVNGLRKYVYLPSGQKVAVDVPAGAEEGQIIQVNYQPDHDPLPARLDVNLRVRAHKLFTRKGVDLYIDCPISLAEAILGAQIAVPTPRGAVKMSVPKGSNTDVVLRLRDKGVHTKTKLGDLYVKFKIVLPNYSDPELERLIESWASKHPYNPRGKNYHS